MRGHTSGMTKPFPLKMGGRTNPGHPAPVVPWKIRACILSPKSSHVTQVVSERTASVRGWWTPVFLSSGKTPSPVAKGGTLGWGTEGLTPQNSSHVKPPPRDLASEHAGSIRAALTASGHPHCYLACGTVSKEGTSV